MTAVDVKNYIRSILVAQRTIAQEYLALDKIIDFVSQAVTDGIPAWTAALVFYTDATHDGAFCLYPDVDGNLRFWQTKVDNNVNHAPSTNPAVHEDAYWKEVSPSSGSAIKEWAAGVFGDGLILVYYDLNGDGTGMDLFKLTDPTRPFNSVDFIAELIAGKWQKLGGPVRSLFNAAGAPIVLDLKHNKESILVGDVVIGAARTWQLNNNSGALKITVLFTISAVFDQTFPASFKMAKIVGDWNSGTQKWTPPDVGDYRAEAHWNGTNWLMEINGPF